MSKYSLYKVATGEGVLPTTRVSITVVVDGQTKTYSQTAATAAANFTPAQLAANGYRLPTLEDAKKLAYAALEDGRRAAELKGAWILQPLDGAAGWYLYAGSPPDSRARITASIEVAKSALGRGAADVFPFPCRSQPDVAIGIPERERAHTLAQLQGVQEAWEDQLNILGGIRTAAVNAVLAATAEAQVDEAVAAAGLQWDGATLAPEAGA